MALGVTCRALNNLVNGRAGRHSQPFAARQYSAHNIQ